MNMFSIIVPVFNVHDYLNRCIESVLKQDYNKWELILIDDGSSDGSGDICDKYLNKDKRIKVIHKSNGGVSSARNYGLRVSCGDYITFLDADDYWERSDVLSSIDALALADVYYMLSVIQRYPSGNKRILSRETIFDTGLISGDIMNYFASRLKSGGWACYYGFYNSEIIKELYFDENIKIGEDADWFFRALANAKTAYGIKKTYYNYCVNRVGSAMYLKKADSLVSFFHLVIKWNKLSNDRRQGFTKVYISLSNNAVNYIKTFGLYKREEKELLKEKFLESNAINVADSTYANKIRVGIKIIGLDRVIYYESLKYRIKLLSRDVKRMIMGISR